MAKKLKTKPTKTPQFIVSACHVAGFGPNEIIADQDGKLWRVEIETGHATPVTFGK